MEKNERKIEVETEPGEKLVEIGPIPYDQENPGNKYQLISVNGVTIMLERGKKHKVPERFADAYEYRVKMAGRRIKERERRAQDLRERQNQDGVSFQ
jgi:hypothetical protein